MSLLSGKDASILPFPAVQSVAVFLEAGLALHFICRFFTFWDSPRRWRTCPGDVVQVAGSITPNNGGANMAVSDWPAFPSECEVEER